MRQLQCKALLLLFSVALVSLVPACQRQAPGTRAADEQAIRTASDVDWLKAANAKDVERVLSFYADDALLLPPNAPIATGKEAIRTVWSQFVAIPGFAINWQTTKVEVSRAGDLAYQVASFEVTVNDPKGRPVADRGKYVAVWKRQPDGSWRVITDIWNSNSPPPSAASR